MLAGIETLDARRSAACESFMSRIHNDNPLYTAIDVMTQIPEEFEGIKDYLLKRVFKPNISKIDEPQDAIAEGVLKYFSGFDAFSLPVPTFNPEALLDLKKNLLNPDFLTGTKQFGELLKSKMGPKRSFNGGEFVTGEGMAFLTKLYVDAINGPFSIPNVQIAWETFIRTKCENAKDKAVLAYKRKMETDLSKLPRGASEILASHESAFGESMEIFEKETAGISYESTRMDREELTKEQAEQLSFWKAENDKLTQESCSTLLKELRQKHLDPVLSQLHGPFGTSISFEDIDNACAQIEQDYKDFAFGAKDVCADVFHEFHQHDLMAYFVKGIENLNPKSLKFQASNRKSLEAEMGLYEMMIKNLKCYEETLLKQRRENAQKEKETEEERRIRIRSKGSPADKNLFRNTFPFFFWLLRDVSLKLPRDCENFNQYFSKRVFNEIPNENQEKVAESILSFFRYHQLSIESKLELDCFSLPPPSDDPEIIQHISSNRDKLNPKFREGVKRFEALLKSKLVPKSSINQSEYVTGEALGELVMLYTDAINDPDAIPNVEKAWDIYVKKKMADAKQDALEVYNQCMSHLTRLPCDGNNLLENHESSQKKAMEKYLVETAELISTSLKKDLSELTVSASYRRKLNRLPKNCGFGKKKMPP
ncbi:Guanylate-binding protein 6 [Stylophora pistillata]|uniref:Guanylate-binding protein 6 n=1 Tax=Stylophora pistillata TaxID=50429 RepID=A0A2B4SNE3_STYPI|nr:Guanylate-binding protein 6 [Stylophora pistillata]